MQKKTALILFFILLAASALKGQKKELTFEALFSDRSITGSSIQGVKWFANDTKYSFLKTDPATRSMAVYQHDIKTGEESILINKDDLVIDGDEEGLRIQNYEWSPDEKYMLFTGLHQARGVKSGGAFYIYDFNKNRFFVITGSEVEQTNAAFSPDGNKLGFVRDNNIFVADISSGSIKQLTSDGSDVILNGVFDWVYEEEFSIIKAWEWSPDSRHIAFWRLDQSNVPEIRIAKWDSLYMNTLDMRYPKPGASNSIINIGVVNIDDGKTIWMDIGEEEDIYIPRISFTKNPDLLSIQRLNRLQNRLDFILADIKTGQSNVIFTEESDAWVDVSDDLSFLEDGKRFVWTSEKDGFRHLYLYDYSGKQLSQLTKGNWQVENLYYADNTKIIFSANERGTRFSDLYQVSTDGSGFRRITKEPGVHPVIVSSKGKYYIDRFSNSSTVTSITLNGMNGERIRNILVPQSNPIEDYGFSEIEYFSFKTSDGIDLNAAMIKPWNFDENKKYPVLFDIYGGPGSSSIKDKWGGFTYAWHQLLAKEGYIIFKVDNRGTCGRGTAFKHTVYKRLGEMEVNDMVEAARYLSTLKYVDSTRIGIWGWSYGGYMAAMTITKAANYFKTAVAVAPVTHWKFYDTIYTERYMQTPLLNPRGYEESSVMHYANNYKGNLMIIHGTADDNVHFQNSAALVDKLISENKQFSTMFYPEKEHSIRGGKTRQHLFRLITDYIIEKL